MIAMANAPTRIAADELAEWQEFIAGGRSNTVLLGSILARYAAPLKTMVATIRAKLPRSLDGDDLLQEAWLGMRDAAMRFDPDLGNTFWTFGCPRVRFSIIDYLRRVDHIGRNARSRNERRRQATEELLQELGRKPTEDEIAARCPDGVTLPRLESIDRVVEDGETRELLLRDTLATAFTPIDSRGRQQDDFFREATRSLSMRDQTMLYLYLVRDLTMKHIGQIFGCSESRVSQISTETLVQLRDALDVDELLELLEPSGVDAEDPVPSRFLSKGRTVTMQTSSRLPLPSTNGQQVAPPVAVTAAESADPFAILARLTPTQIQKAREDLDARFAQQKQEHSQQKKLLDTLSKGLGGSTQSNSKANTDAREAASQRIVDFVGQKRTATLEEIRDGLELPKAGLHLKLRSLVKHGRLREAKKGTYSPAKS